MISPPTATVAGRADGDGGGDGGRGGSAGGSTDLGCSLELVASRYGGRDSTDTSRSGFGDRGDVGETPPSSWLSLRSASSAAGQPARPPALGG